MSGLITSLLIEPVVRQARRLSYQTDSLPPSDHHHPEPTHPPPTRTRTSSDTTTFPNLSNLKRKSQSGLGNGHCSQNGLSSSVPASSPIHSSVYPPRDSFLSPRQTEDSSGDLSCQSEESRLEATRRTVSMELGRGVRSNNSQQVRWYPREPEMSAENPPRYDETNSPFLLPEDDGMGILRRKIHVIRDLDSSNSEKARLIHELMTENYNALQESSHQGASKMVPSPSSSPYLTQSAPPVARWREQSFNQPPTAPPSSSSTSDKRNLYNVTAEDLKPTFFPKAEPESFLGDADDIDTEELEETSLGCQHYKRNVKLQCFSCKKWYTCRFCHDEFEDHHLDRPKTENMLCMLCGYAQPAAQFCRQCDEQAAQYFCNTCKLWDNDSSKSIYHCTDCGICRIGQGLGKDFFHCKTCSVCLPISIENTHRCIERSTQCDCPICGDYMFTSPETVVFMRCGHSIHQKCLSEYSKSSYRCPICNKTIANMESTFRNLDRTIQSQPMPAEFADTKALVYCNDCGAKSVVAYHWLGLRCDMCESYNTAQLRILHGDDTNISENDGEGRDISTSRIRPPTHDAHEALSPAFASLQLDTHVAQGTNSNSRLNAPSSAEPSRQFASYSLTRGRAVSPVISNYFGIPPDRGSDRSQSTSFFGGHLSRDAEKDDAGEVRLWGTKFKYKYGFLSRETESADGTSDGDGENDDASEYSNSEENDANDANDDDDDDDDDDEIDIFGHR